MGIWGNLGIWGSGGGANSRKLGEFIFLWDRGLNLGIWGSGGGPRTVASQENSYYYGIEGSIWVFGGLGGGPEQSQVRRIHISMGSRAQFGYLGVWGGGANSRKLGEFICPDKILVLIRFQNHPQIYCPEKTRFGMGCPDKM